MERLFVVLSALTISIAYIPFIVGTVKGTVIPNRMSWIIWFIQDGLMFTSALCGGIGPATVMPSVWTLGTGIVVVLSFKKGNYAPITGLEKICLVLSGLGILLWATTGSPRLGLIASVSASCVGGIPTTLKAWKEPWTETISGWLLMVMGTIFSSLAIQQWTFDSSFLPIAIGLFQISVVLPLISYKIKKSITHS
ncbi:MAG: hypothetical protein KGI50_00940 [Patescibacteria group bacterium]|nr:hypothetical protein [Patescibacteria group bacterium]MDE2438081.1 hypothetical protein [Patescibacteria group bacterium]